MGDWPDYLKPSLRVCASCGARLRAKSGFMANVRLDLKGKEVSVWVTCTQPGCIGYKPKS